MRQWKWNLETSQYSTSLCQFFKAVMVGKDSDHLDKPFSKSVFSFMFCPLEKYESFLIRLVPVHRSGLGKWYSFYRQDIECWRFLSHVPCVQIRVIKMTEAEAGHPKSSSLRNEWQILRNQVSALGNMLFTPQSHCRFAVLVAVISLIGLQFVSAYFID